jgi:hypothetical protein
MTAQSVQVRRVISRSQAILAKCLTAELSRAIVCCRIAELKERGAEKLPYLIVAERTSSKFIKLYLQGKIGKSKSVLELMVRLEEALGGTANILRPLNAGNSESMFIGTEDD